MNIYDLSNKTMRKILFKGFFKERIELTADYINVCQARFDDCNSE